VVSRSSIHIGHISSGLWKRAGSKLSSGVIVVGWIVFRCQGKITLIMDYATDY
jgi:hypothetical protein